MLSSHAFVVYKFQFIEHALKISCPCCGVTFRATDRQQLKLTVTDSAYQLDSQKVWRSTNHRRVFLTNPMRPEVVHNFRVTQLSCTGKDQLDVVRKCGVFNYILVGKRGFYRRRIKEIRMVVLMDIVAEGDGDKGRCNKDSRTEETTKDRCLMLGNLIPSTIPNSLIYRYEDFISNKIANGFYGDIFKVRICLELHIFKTCR